MKIWGAAVCMAVVSLLHFTQARADVYQSGDLIVTDNHGGNYHGVVLDINRTTGAQRVIASIEQPTGVCIDASGDLIVADYGGPVGDNGRIIRIDHRTGQQSVVSTGGMMYNPSAVAVNPSGQLLVAARTQDQLYGTILKIDPVTGAQTMFGGPPLLTGSLEGIAISSDGRNYFVTAYQGGPNIVAFDAATKSPTILSTLNALNWNTRGLAIDPANPQELFVAADHWTGVGGGSLLAIDTVTGNTTTLSSGRNLVRATSVAEDPAGDLFVTDAGLDGNPSGMVLQINPVTGQQSMISEGDNLLSPGGIIVVPEPSAALVLAGAGFVVAVRRKRQTPNCPHR